MIYPRSVYIVLYILLFFLLQFCSYNKKAQEYHDFQHIENNLDKAKNSLDSNHIKKSSLYLDIVFYDLDWLEKNIESISDQKQQQIELYRNRTHKMYDDLFSLEIKRLREDNITLDSKTTTKWISKVLEKDQLQSYTLPIPKPIPPKVIQHMTRFLTHERKNFTVWLSRFYYYQSFIENQLKKENLPRDLIYVAMVESGLNIKAYSSAHAAGLWQLIRATARIFDLKSNWWFDERRDPVKATKAALSYLTYLYKQFKSWDLTLAAYNAGEGRVRSQIRKHTNNYWEMKLPKETQNYVARILAAMIIGNNPEKYGFYPTRELPQIFGVHDTVTIFHPMDLKFISNSTGSNYTEIKRLNPELKRWTTPPNLKSYHLKIPLGTKEAFLQDYSNTDKSLFTNWRRHKIKVGETLGHIAQKYKVPVSVIIEANKLTSNLIVAGQFLLVPKSITDFKNKSIPVKKS